MMLNAKNLKIVALCATLAIQTTVTLGYETDNFTDRNTLKKDSLKALDAKVNHILELAAVETRKQEGKYCNKAVLRQEIVRWLRPDPAGILELWVELSDQIERTHVSIFKSVYQDVTFFEQPALRTVGIARSILLDGHIVGTDKVGHFFLQGLSYYDLVDGGKPLEKVLVEDHHEDTYWGLEGTGVFSYGDMAANYQGYRFWSELTQGENPYFKCDQATGWKKNRDFTWANYANDAWDEALNCSEFIPAIRKKFDHTMSARGFTCPMIPEKCAEITKLDHADFFLSPKCKAASDQVIAARKADRRLASF